MGKNSQEEYEELMADSQKKRAADSKSITTKEQAKAEADSVAETATENLNSSNQELYATKEYIANLHKSCDFLLENYDFRKTARATEIDALKKAKAVLKGADYSFLQVSKQDPCDCIGNKSDPNCDCIGNKSFLAKKQDPCDCIGNKKPQSFVQIKAEDSPCVTLCKEMNQYPNCQCPNFTYDATPNHMTWDELYTHFDQLIERGRQQLKDARKNA